MKFKKIFFIFLLFIFPANILTACSFAKPAPRSDKPNIIIIITDDQPQHTLQFMPQVQTELVRQGINFTNAYVTTPLCCPSRASILTGQYVFRHGVKTNRQPDGGASVFDDSSTLPVWMQAGGYKTALIGKYLNDYDALPEGYIPAGWDEWNALVLKDPAKDFYYGYTLNENGKIVQYGFDSQDYSTDVFSQKAVDFIRQNSDAPFFLMFMAYAPHQPYLAAERHKDMFKTYDETFSIYKPDNYFEEDISDKPAWLNRYEPQDQDYVEKVHQRMLRSLMSVDDAVGEIVKTLEKEGIRNNTVIIFMSDNGFALGDHRLIGKACPYEACLKIPLVVSYPNTITNPSANENFVLNIDIAPTVLELAGISNLSVMDGESFAELLSNPSAIWRDGFLIEQYQDDGEERGMTSFVPAYNGFQTKEWKYVEYVTGEQELYNLLIDPFEMNNLASLPEYQNMIQAMQERIKAIKGNLEN
ncbi:MAG: sulfatase [Anaerolineales bacterium]|nr:sulfatase [Anaerolineales bacterium]